MPIDVYAAMRAMLRAEATRHPVAPRTGTADPSPPAVDPAAPVPVDATVRDTSPEEAVPAPPTVPAPSAAPRPVRRARAYRCLSRCRAVLRAVRHAVSSCFAGRASRQGR
ncbi:hypothetical protein JK364_04955 [Streptomyces sp. 110]|uniref:Uncharacterized protein n=1 Tax=Streptomyces endocoffeicus TaxID=2898945 RepID=A0ABS1PHA6_9ACTN|nr:hypothetical protein [Streptomyces endocoffeicus]MBL1111763.1 hypothetical protein [Streptomyces endocoffeicus]